MNHYKEWSYPEFYELIGNEYITSDSNVLITHTESNTKILAPITVGSVIHHDDPETFLKETVEKYIDNLNK